jgi:hypothetical protein
MFYGDDVSEVAMDGLSELGEFADLGAEYEAVQAMQAVQSMPVAKPAYAPPTQDVLSCRQKCKTETEAMSYDVHKTYQNCRGQAKSKSESNSCRSAWQSALKPFTQRHNACVGGCNRSMVGQRQDANRAKAYAKQMAYKASKGMKGWEDDGLDGMDGLADLGAADDPTMWSIPQAWSSAKARDAWGGKAMQYRNTLISRVYRKQASPSDVSAFDSRVRRISNLPVQNRGLKGWDDDGLSGCSCCGMGDLGAAEGGIGIGTIAVVGALAWLLLKK